MRVNSPCPYALPPQVHHFVYLWHRFWAVEGLWHKLSILMKGPGWAPGKPRLGCIDDIPKVRVEELNIRAHPFQLWPLELIMRVT